MAEQTDIVEASIVCAGNFNPAIFSPAWFRLNELISEGELEAAQLSVVHPQIAQFSIEHLTFTVETEKFMIKTTSDPIIRISDMMSVIFEQLLPHTPIKAVGINYGEHWRVDSWQQRVALGRALAPIEPWGAWGETFCSDDRDLVAGLTHLSIKQPFSDGLSHKRVKVEPSMALTDKYRGVHVDFNHHRESESIQPATDFAARVISEEFDDAIKFAKVQLNSFRTYIAGLEI